MASASGFVVRLTEARYAVFDDSLSGEVSFGEPVPEFVCSRSVPLLAVIVHNRQITHIADAKRGVRAGTELRRLNLTNVQRLRKPLSIAVLLRHVPKRVRRFVKDRLKSGGLIPPISFAGTVDALIRLVPDLRQRLGRFGEERRERIKQLGESTKEALGLQKVAVTTALMLAGLPRASLQDWDPGDQKQPTSFLDGLPTARIREDPMLINDLNVLPGHEYVGRHISGAAMFEGEYSRLTVVLANRQPLEEQLGVDLIYFNETFRSFVMVQYKAMERENDDSVFRLPNAQLDHEIERMNAVRTRFDGQAVLQAPNNFRLSSNPFFLKLCPRIIFNPDDSGLVPGMYISLDYWNLIASDPSTLGKKNGRVITYKNIGRYFDNSEFTMLVTKAWVGTTEEQSDLLERVIRETIESGKAVAIGIKTNQSPEVLSSDPEYDEMGRVR